MLEAHVFWHRFKTEIFAVIVVAVLAIIGFGGYRFYSEFRNSAASALLGTAKGVPDYQQVIARYPNTPAGAAAHLLLAQAQRNDRKFAESNATLQVFLSKNPKHELMSSAKMAIAANLESMGKMDEALSIYQQVAEIDRAREEESFPKKIKNLFGKQAPALKNFNAPLALISQVHLLKAKNQNDAARRICETILTQYRDSAWANEAMRELRSLKPQAPAKPPATLPVIPGLAPPEAPEISVSPPLAPPPRPPPAPAPKPPAPKP